MADLQPTSRPAPAGAAGRVSRDSAVLAIGSVVNGLAAYVFVILGTRALGAEGFAPVAVLWGFWAFAGASLGFPIQHWAIRQMEIDGGSEGVAAARRRLLVLAAAVSIGLGLVAFLLRDRLFGSSDLFWPIAVMVLALGTAYLGLVRGLLAGRGRFAAAATVIGGENIVRVVAAILAITLWNDARGFAVALLLGPLIGLIWREPVQLMRRPGPSPPPITLIGAAGVGLLISQLILHGGPAVLAAIGGSEGEVTVLFAALALFRAPYLIALGLTVRGTGPMTRLVLERAYGKVARLSAATVGAALLLAVAAAAIAAGIGPALIEAVFGPGTRPEPWVAAAIAAGSVLALGGLLQVITLIATARQPTLVISWASALLAAALVLISGPSDALTRVVIAFVTAELVASLLMATGLIRWALAKRQEVWDG